MIGCLCKHLTSVTQHSPEVGRLLARNTTNEKCVNVCEQLQASEYRKAIQHLMTDCKFRCHNYCYNVPLVTLMFTLLFSLSVTLVPVIEQQLIQTQLGTSSSRVHHTGLEFIHGIIAWLFILAIYLIVSQLAKSKVYSTWNLAFLDVQLYLSVTGTITDQANQSMKILQEIAQRVSRQYHMRSVNSKYW